MTEGQSKRFRVCCHESFRVQVLAAAIAAIVSSFPAVADSSMHRARGPAVPQISKALQSIDREKHGQSFVSIHLDQGAVRGTGSLTLVVAPTPAGGAGTTTTVLGVFGASLQAGPSVTVAAPGNAASAGATSSASPLMSAGGGSMANGTVRVQMTPGTSTGGNTPLFSSGNPDRIEPAVSGSGSSPQPKPDTAAVAIGSIAGSENSAANSTLITTSNGEILLAAGKSVELVNPGTPNLGVEVTAPQDQTLNLRKIVSDIKRRGILAGLHADGRALREKTVAATADGRILLRLKRKVFPDVLAPNAKTGSNDCDTDRLSGAQRLPTRFGSIGADHKGAPYRAAGSNSGFLRTAFVPGNRATRAKPGMKNHAGNGRANIRAGKADRADTRRRSTDGPTQDGAPQAQGPESGASQAATSPDPGQRSAVQTAAADIEGAATKPASEPDTDNSPSTAGAGKPASGACS